MTEKVNQQTNEATVCVNALVGSAIEEYQCPGCVCGSDTECYEKGDNLECKKHVAGTMAMPHIGKFLLGMPTGFCRTGNIEEFKVYIFENLSKGWGFDKFNVPVWKHLDKNGNTLVRGISPRINAPFLHVVLGDCMDDIDCLEINQSDIDEMD